MKPFQEKRPAFANHHPLLTSQVQYSKNIPLRQPSVPDTDSERNIVYTIRAVPFPILSLSELPWKKKSFEIPAPEHSLSMESGTSVSALRYRSDTSMISPRATQPVSLKELRRKSIWISFGEPYGRNRSTPRHNILAARKLLSGCGLFIPGRILSASLPATREYSPPNAPPDSLCEGIGDAKPARSENAGNHQDPLRDQTGFPRSSSTHDHTPRVKRDGNNSVESCLHPSPKSTRENTKARAPGPSDTPDLDTGAPRDSSC